MASIEGDIRAIREAIYGRDVREAIADGIEKVNEATEADARDIEDLTDDLEELDAAVKAEARTVEGLADDLEELDAAVKAEARTVEGLADDLEELDTAVKAEARNVKAINDELNELNGLSYELIPNTFIDYRNGNEAAFQDVNFFSTNFVNVIGRTSIFIANYRKSTYAEDFAGLAFYDSNYEFVSGIQYISPYEKTKIAVPKKAVYMRASYFKDVDADLQITVGSAELYERHAIDVPAIKDELNELNGLSYELIPNTFIDYRNGNAATIQNVNFFSTNFVNVIGQTSIFIANYRKSTYAEDFAGLAFYDSNYEFVSGIQYIRPYEKTKITVPKKAVYMRASYFKDVDADLQITVGSAEIYKRQAIDVPAIKDELNELNGLPYELIPNTFIDYRNGNEAAFQDVNFFSTNFVNVIGQTSIFIANYRKSTYTEDFAGLAFYDSNYEFVSGIQYIRPYEKTKITVPKKAVYMRASYFKDVDADLQITVGSAELYEYFANPNKEEKKSIHFTPVQRTYVDYTSGNIGSIDNDTFFTTDYVGIDSYDLITLFNYRSTFYDPDLSGAAFYDSNKSFIRGIQYVRPYGPLEINVPVNAAYFRATYFSDSGGTFSIIASVSKSETMNYIPVHHTYIDYHDGSVVSFTGNDTFYTTDYARVDSYKKIILKNYRSSFYDSDNAGIAFYDINKRFVQGVQYIKPFDALELNVPARAVYMRATYFSDSGGEFVIYTKSGGNEDGEYVIHSVFSLFESVGVVGDSYASGALTLTSTSGLDHYSISWPQIVARKNGISVVNLSKGGLTTRNWLTDDRGLSRLNSESAKDLYILTLGINDNAGLGLSYIGTVSDISSQADTFYGNYGKIINAIKAHAPYAKIVISTMAPSAPGSCVPQYNDAIQSIAAYFEIPCIIQGSDPYFVSSDYTGNIRYNHPTAYGYAMMAGAFDRLLYKAMKEYPDYFLDYGVHK